MANRWLSFLKEYRKKNPSLSMKAAMKQGAVAYKKTKAPTKAKSKKVKKKSK